MPVMQTIIYITFCLCSPPELEAGEVIISPIKGGRKTRTQPTYLSSYFRDGKEGGGVEGDVRGRGWSGLQQSPVQNLL